LRLFARQRIDAAFARNAFFRCQFAHAGDLAA
jgi:hypothetical protein